MVELTPVNSTFLTCCAKKSIFNFKKKKLATGGEPEIMAKNSHADTLQVNPTQ